MKFRNIINASLLLGVFSVGVTSCDFLETTPQDFTDPEQFYTTEQECEMALTGVYLSLAQQAVYGADYSIRLSATDDLCFFSSTSKAEHPSLNGHTPATIEVSNAWDELYRGINNANVLLEHIDSADFDLSAKNRIKGEAKFLRAYYHFLLVQGWYEVPVRKESIKDKSKTTLAATPHLEALDWIIDEMRTSRMLVDSTRYDSNPSRVKKTTVEGILARVFLWKAGYNKINRNDASAMENVDLEELKHCYDSAAYYAKKVVDSNKHHLISTESDPENISLLWRNLAADKYDNVYNESIWEVEFKGNRQGGTWTEGTFGAFIGNRQQTPSPTHELGYCAAYYNGTPLLWQLLSEDPNDLRKDLSLAPYIWKNVDVNTVDEHGKPVLDAQGNQVKHKELKPVDWTEKVKTGRFCGKFRREWETGYKVKAKNYTTINFPILRYADVLLMLAEAEYGKLNPECAVEGTGAPSQAALDPLNEVRKRAHAEEYELTVSNFGQKIMDERARELCFESTRRFDLVRWGKYEDQIKVVLNGMKKQWDEGNWSAAETYIKATEPKHAFYPIPSTETTVNVELKQNKFWSNN